MEQRSTERKAKGFRHFFLPFFEKRSARCTIKLKNSLTFSFPLLYSLTFPITKVGDITVWSLLKKLVCARFDLFISIVSIETTTFFRCATFDGILELLSLLWSVSQKLKKKKNNHPLNLSSGYYVLIFFSVQFRNTLYRGKEPTCTFLEIYTYIEVRRNEIKLPKKLKT